MHIGVADRHPIPPDILKWCLNALENNKITEHASVEDVISKLDAQRNTSQPNTALTVTTLWRGGRDMRPEFVQKLFQLRAAMQAAVDAYEADNN